MNLEEHEKWAKDNIDSSSSANSDAEAEKAQKRFEELTAGMTVEVIQHDWKDHGGHMKEVCKVVKEINATTMHYFPDFYEFSHGSLDSIITVVSVEDMTEEFAEILVDLIVNLGADG